MTLKSHKVYSPEELLSKAQAYCAYQERCKAEVREKLNALGASSSAIDKIIDQLEKDEFIDEKRFAGIYAYGKFSSKGWGKVKIYSMLKQKQINEPVIKQALTDIDDKEYRNKLKAIINKKSPDLQKEDKTIKNQKLLRFAHGKGYEYDLIIDVLKEMELY